MPETFLVDFPGKRVETTIEVLIDRGETPLKLSLFERDQRTGSSAASVKSSGKDANTAASLNKPFVRQCSLNDILAFPIPVLECGPATSAGQANRYVYFADNKGHATLDGAIRAEKDRRNNLVQQQSMALATRQQRASGNLALPPVTPHSPHSNEYAATQSLQSVSSPMAPVQPQPRPGFISRSDSLSGSSSLNQQDPNFQQQQLNRTSWGKNGIPRYSMFEYMSLMQRIGLLNSRLSLLQAGDDYTHSGGRAGSLQLTGDELSSLERNGSSTTNDNEPISEDQQLAARIFSPKKRSFAKEDGNTDPFNLSVKANTVNAPVGSELMLNSSFAKNFCYMSPRCEYYTISPSLPAGLHLDADTGCVYGRVTEVFKDGVYTVKGSHSLFQDQSSKKTARTEVAAPPFQLKCTSTSLPADLSYKFRCKSTLPPSYWKPLPTYLFEQALGSYFHSGRPTLNYPLSDQKYRQVWQQRVFVDHTYYYRENLLRQEQQNSFNAVSSRQGSNESQKDDVMLNLEREATARRLWEMKKAFNSEICRNFAMRRMHALSAQNGTQGKPENQNQHRISWVDAKIHDNNECVHFSQSTEEEIDASVFGDGSHYKIEPESHLRALGLNFCSQTGTIHGWLRSNPQLLSRNSAAALDDAQYSEVLKYRPVGLTFKVSFCAGQGIPLASNRKMVVDEKRTAVCEIKIELFPRDIPRAVRYEFLGDNSIKGCAQVTAQSKIPQIINQKQLTASISPHSAQENSMNAANDRDFSTKTVDEFLSPEKNSSSSPASPQMGHKSVASDSNPSAAQVLTPPPGNLKPQVITGNTAMKSNYIEGFARSPSMSLKMVAVQPGTVKSGTIFNLQMGQNVKLWPPSYYSKMADSKNERYGVHSGAGSRGIMGSAGPWGGRDEIPGDRIPDPVEYCISPDRLPRGLTFCRKNGALLGVCQAPINKKFVITASNKWGSCQDTVDLNIPKGAAPPLFHYEASSHSAFFNVPQFTFYLGQTCTTGPAIFAEWYDSYVSGEVRFKLQGDTAATYMNPGGAQLSPSVGSAVAQGGITTTAGGPVAQQIQSNNSSIRSSGGDRLAVLTNSSVLPKGLFFCALTGAIGGHIDHHGSSVMTGKTFTVIAYNRNGESKVTLEIEIRTPERLYKIEYREKDKERLSNGSMTIGKPVRIEVPFVYITEKDAIARRSLSHERLLKGTRGRTKSSEIVTLGASSSAATSPRTGMVSTSPKVMDEHGKEVRDEFHETPPQNSSSAVSSGTKNGYQSSYKKQLIQQYAQSVRESDIPLGAEDPSLMSTELQPLPGTKQNSDVINLGQAGAAHRFPDTIRKRRRNIFWDTSLRIRFEIVGGADVLPMGLHFDSTAGMLFGSPKEAFKKTAITINAVTSWGSVLNKDVLTIFVPIPEAPSSITYPKISRFSMWRHPIASFVRGQLSETGLPIVTGGKVKKFHLQLKSGSWPRTLAFDEVTGNIGGFIPRAIDNETITLPVQVIAESGMIYFVSL